MNLTEIIGLKKGDADKLIKAGISSVEDLVPLTKNDIKSVSKKTGISEENIDTWQEHADFMRIENIGPTEAFIINNIGIDSVKELARRNPKSTYEKIKEYLEANPKTTKKPPTQKIVEEWINKAKVLEPPKKRAKKEEDEEPLIPILPTWTPKQPEVPAKPEKQKDDYGQYGPEYWNSKWVKQPIIYTGRALRGSNYNKQIDVDVKTFIKNNDEILKHVIKEAKLKKDTFNATALACQKFVCEMLAYTFDEESSDCVEFWQFPFETIQSAVGDCEDGAILISSLLINAGIPSWRIKCVGGAVLPDPTAPAAPGEELGGHGWTIYLADRADSERQLEWVVLDWCYCPDPEITVEDKPLAREGGQEGAYKDVWFTYNDEYSWAPEQIAITEARISKNRTTTKDNVLEVKEFLNDMVKQIFDKLDIQIE
ncbi:MAG: DUF4332 domain-containing protein [Candidatus Lokiarchaeota archaeon]|nr:DUF4332 domain-containing protein [Candidatus Lokiarchaeota archaeon]